MKWLRSLKLRWLALVPLVVLLGAGVVAFTERDSLRSWYVLRGLRQASEDDAPQWVEKVVETGESALPGLLALLDSEQPQERTRAEQVLTSLGIHWGADDSRTEELAQTLVSGFLHRSVEGQCASLRIARGWYTPSAPDRLATQAGRLLVVASATTHDAVRREALELAVSAVRQPVHPETRHAIHALTQQGLKATDVESRLHAVELASQSGGDYSTEMLGLLQDAAPELRRTVLLLLWPCAKAVPTDALLPWLHDADDEVRRLCERALRQRGLNSDSIRLAKLISDPRWTARLEVLDQLEEVPELDATVWLRRLTHDPAPAVRLAAIRAASESQLDVLADRLEQMTREDPSPTVADLARHYRQNQRQNRGMQP